MVIDKNKPLPPHTKLDYDECRAKLILEELFADRYSDLILADKPDLQGNNVGIEVTMANNRKSQEAVSNWVKAYHCTDPKEQKRYIERMGQLGVEYSGGVQCWPPIKLTFDLTQETVETKIQKLKNGNYKPFPRYELFIFTDTWYHEGIVESAKKYLFNRSIGDYYKTVYVLSQGKFLHVFSIETGEHKLIELDSSEQANRNIRARDMVEQAEMQ